MTKSKKKRKKEWNEVDFKSTGEEGPEAEP